MKINFGSLLHDIQLSLLSSDFHDIIDTRLITLSREDASSASQVASLKIAEEAILSRKITALRDVVSIIKRVDIAHDAVCDYVLYE